MEEEVLAKELEDLKAQIKEIKDVLTNMQEQEDKEEAIMESLIEEVE